MARRRDYEGKSLRIQILPYSILILGLLPICSHGMTIVVPEKNPNFLNITRVSTYSMSSPNHPGEEGSSVAETGSNAASDTTLSSPVGGNTDSSAQATDHGGRSFPVGQGGRHPSQILGKPSGEGHWATPRPDSTINLPYVPFKLYSQVRHTYEVNHKPRSDALASASTAAELAAAARLKESIQTKKISEVYSEEGYEDTAYDHAGFKKDAGFSEGDEGHEGGKRKKGGGGGGEGSEGHGWIAGAATSLEDQKYPFHKVPNSEAVPILSPLRYALNPASSEVPSKSSGGTEFYDSTDDVECPTVVELASIPGRALRRPPEAEEDGETAADGEGGESGEESKEPKLSPTPTPPPTPRLKGLGNKIDCLKVKFFGGEEPLDNPFFKEQVVNVAKNEIQRAKEEESRIKEQIEEEKNKEEEEENKTKEESESVREETKVPATRKDRGKAKYSSAGFHRRRPSKSMEESEIEEKSTTASPPVAESRGEDRIGEETEDSAIGGVGAAVEGLPSGTASDSDMQGFYADIMGHIQSATGNIVRQAYSGKKGDSSNGRGRRIRPPKPPRPPVIGFVDERQPYPASPYPSVLPAPSSYDSSSDNRQVTVDDGEEGEEYAGSEREEEEEEAEDEAPPHRPQHLPHFLKGAHRIILRPINPQQQRFSGGFGGVSTTEKPFRPSPQLFLQTHPSPQRVVPPAHSQSITSGESYTYGDNYQQRPHSHPSESNSYHHQHHHHPSSSGVRTFLVPAGKRPIPLAPSPMGHRYHVNSLGGYNGLRSSSALLIPSSTRHAPTTPIYPSMYSNRGPSNSFKRHSPIGQEFDGLLTATTQTFTTFVPPPPGYSRNNNLRQPLFDMVAASSSNFQSIVAPRNIEYFTLKDSIPRGKRRPPLAAKLLPPESETLIPQITFTTTERYTNTKSYKEESNVAPTPPTNVITERVHDGSSRAESVTQGYPTVPTPSDAALTSKAMAIAISDSSLQATAMSTTVGKLVTDEVTKGIVRTAIEEGAKKRRKGPRDSMTSNQGLEVDGTGVGNAAQNSRNRRRKFNKGSKNPETVLGSEEIAPVEPIAEEIVQKEGRRLRKNRLEERKDSETPRTTTPKPIDTHGERMRRGERGSSRTRIGLVESKDSKQHGVRGGRRREPGYNSPNEESVITADGIEFPGGRSRSKSGKTKRSLDGQQVDESRTGVVTKVPNEPSQDPSRVKNPRQTLGPSEIDQSEITENSQNHRVLGQIELQEPIKMFVEPRIRGDRRRVQIPRKTATRSRTPHRIRVTANPKDGESSTGARKSGIGQERDVSGSSDAAVKQWEASKRRILPSLEDLGEGRGRGRQRETERENPRAGTSINRSVNSRVENTQSPKNQRVMRQRDVKETLTSLYELEE